MKTKHLMFNCREVTQRVSTAMDKDLPWRERVQIWLHLAMCRYCARFKRQLAQMRTIFRQLPAEDRRGVAYLSLSKNARHRIGSRIQQLQTPFADE